MTDIEALDEQQSDEERTAGSAPNSQGADGPGVGTEDAMAGRDDVASHDDMARRAEEEASEVEGDLGELIKTAAQRDEYLALAQRTQADFENYRKRVARDSATAHERGIAKLAKELLPALDSLDRALEGAAQDDPLLDGVRLVRAELGAALGRVGIEAFSPLGEVFDPNEHEAVAQAPVEGAQSGTVAEVYQTGYRTVGGSSGSIGSRGAGRAGTQGGPGAAAGGGGASGATAATVIRPARVLVAA